MEEHGGYLQNIGLGLGPRDLEQCDVWPKERAHLLGDGYNYRLVTVLLKNGWTCSDALLHFHYPSLYENPLVLFCDIGEHVVIYIAEPIDKVLEIR